MNNTQLDLLLQDLQKAKNGLDIAIEDCFEQIRHIQHQYDAMADNCDTLVEQLRECRRKIHALESERLSGGKL